jgi:GTP-binding protein
VYEGQVVGIHQRPGDLKVNVAKKKAVNNIRSATKENTTGLSEAKVMLLDDALEYVVGDEIIEITPLSVRIAKVPKASKFGR